MADLRIFPVACGVTASLVLSMSAEAVIIHPDHEPLAAQRDRPADAVIGWWNGGSAVAIDPEFFLASAHQGTSSTIDFGGQVFDVAEYHEFHDGSDQADFVLGRIESNGPPLTDYAPITAQSTSAVMDEEFAIGGLGRTRGDHFTGQQHGYEWGELADEPVWGFNSIASKFSGYNLEGYRTDVLRARFNSPSQGVDGEATIAAGDSGGGWFIKEEGQWHTFGISVAVTFSDEAVYNPTESMWAADLTQVDYREFINGIVPERIPGDLTLDGFVGGDDLDLVLGNWGADAADVPGTWRNFRPAEGEIVGGDHLDLVLGNWGETVQTASLPEPGSLALLGSGAGLLMMRRRR